MAADTENNPQRRLDDQHPDKTIDWSKPEAPAVPLPSTAGAARQGGNTILEGLTRYNVELYALGDRYFSESPSGRWVEFADVERLLAHAGAPAKLTDERIIEIRNEIGTRYNSAAHVSATGAIELARAIESEVLGAHATQAPAGGISAAQFEEIAQSWDGCEYDDAMIPDIGAALRADFKRLGAHAAVEAAKPAAWMATDRATGITYFTDDEAVALKWPSGTARPLFDPAAPAVPTQPTQAEQVAAVRRAALEEAAALVESEVPCSCCFSEDAVTLAEHLAERIHALATKEAAAEAPSQGCQECLHTYCLLGEKCRHCGHEAESQGWKGGKAPESAQGDKGGDGE